MSRLSRATGIALATVVVAAGATYARPSFAEELDVPTSTSTSYFDHALAAPVPVEPAFTVPAVNLVDEDAEEPKAQSLQELVAEYASTEVPDNEHDCLAGAVYFESKGEPLEGQLAVAEVILNRASSGRFPSSVCGVVKQKSQFSFVRGGRIPSIPRSSEAWRKAVAIAHIAKKDLADSDVGKAMFFHARYVSPRWRLTRVASIGNHIFYR